MFAADIQHPIIVREAAEQDAPAIVRLICQLAADSEITEEYARGYLSGTGHVLLAESGSAVVGLLSYSLRADLFHAGNSALIEELVVDETCRGQGIGGALIDAFLQQARELHCKEVCLAVMPDNADAIRFYKEHGLTDEALFLEKHFAWPG